MTVLYIFAVCAPAEADAVNAAANEFFGDSGANLSIPMSGDGALPITRYGGGAWIPPARLTALNDFIAGRGFSTLDIEVWEDETHEEVVTRARAGIFARFGVRPIELED